MFKILNFFKKKESGNSSQEAAEKAGSLISKKIDNLSNFFNDKLTLVLNEYDVIKDKVQNLRTTNYLLGLKHLENGKISEAIFPSDYIVIV